MDKKPSGFFSRNRTLLIIFGIILVGGLAYAGWRLLLPQQVSAAPITPAYQTFTIRRGDLSLSVNGTGTVTANQTVDLNFPTEGTIGQLKVQVGQQVKQGDILATLADVEKLQLAVENNLLAVQTAQQALDDLQNSGQTTVAQALSDRAAAQAALADAQKNVRYKGQPRCNKNTTETYYYQYLYQSRIYNQWSNYLADGNTGYSNTYILQKLRPMKTDMDRAYINWKYCEGYTDQEIADLQANLATAKANAAQAEANYQTVLKDNGVDPIQVKIDQAALDSAKLQLTKSQNDLEGATIVAPMDGTVSAINSQVGQPSGSGALISLVNLQDPQIQVNIDETDVQNFGVNCPAVVTFNSLPGQSFPGVVSQVSPALVTVQNVASAQGTITLNSQPKTALPLGLNANVEVTCQQANNALMVPTQAIHETAGQPAYVYILNAQGTPEKREVVVGLKTTAFDEVTSGVNVGDRVITSPVNQP